MNEMNDLQKNLFDLVKACLLARKGKILEADIDDELDFEKNRQRFKKLSAEEVEFVRVALKSEIVIVIDTYGYTIKEPHQKWWLMRKSELEDLKYWNRYRKYLIMDKNFSQNAIDEKNGLDNVTDDLTDLLGNPKSEKHFARKGLVIGDVQSGKTSNYMGLICKAIDAGYKTIILLTGTIEKLRKQTQERMDEGVVGCDSNFILCKQENKQDKYVGAGNYSDPPFHPLPFTSKKNDFKTSAAETIGVLDLDNVKDAVIFVVKKNVTPLKWLNKWIDKQITQGREQLDNTLLLVDDEADNASVNTKNSEQDPTVINKNIRELLAKFTKSSYVGFTATPFANIFIEPPTKESMQNEDLYPKDYICCLNAPSNYIGVRDIFLDDSKYENMLVTIDDNENNEDSAAAIFHTGIETISKLPDDLKTSIETFVLANAIEDLEGRIKTHRSMVINVSIKIPHHKMIADLVNSYLETIKMAVKICRNEKLSAVEALKNERIAKLKKTYEQIYHNKNMDEDWFVEYTWEQIYDYLGRVNVIEVRIQNKDSKETALDPMLKPVEYDTGEYKENGGRFIIVGGFGLSRGLTLEGLVVSYFFRSTKMYDTLLQMGRWFGYRFGYEKLCRIFMTGEAQGWYQQIAIALEELRKDIKRYEGSSYTPMDFGLRVREDPQTLLMVTARNKMKSAESRECLVSLACKYVATGAISYSEEVYENNFATVTELVDKLEKQQCDKLSEHEELNGQFGYLKVSNETVIDFLNKINVSVVNDLFDPKNLANFIQGYKGNELANWDVVFVTGSSQKEVDFGYGIKLHPTFQKFTVDRNNKVVLIGGKRQRLANPENGQLALTQEKINQVLDFAHKDGRKNASVEHYFRAENLTRNPLLVIYTVELSDVLKNETHVSEDEQLKNKIVLGFGIGIPGLSHTDTKYLRYVVNKKWLEQHSALNYGEDPDEREDD